ncbi:hypothetical protein BC628DRAFT_419755 [Trametes gibbosa]|nr:hypothetical protein BC628DRAFT_419755 [Trametes gibbosa]
MLFDACRDVLGFDGMRASFVGGRVALMLPPNPRDRCDTKSKHQPPPLPERVSMLHSPHPVRHAAPPASAGQDLSRTLQSVVARRRAFRRSIVAGANKL